MEALTAGSLSAVAGTRLMEQAGVAGSRRPER